MLDTDENVGHRADMEEEDMSVLEVAGNSAENNFIDEPPEWDSESSDEEDILLVTGHEEANSDEPDLRKGYSQFNQKRVTRSGRRIIAAKHFMFDTGGFIKSLTF